MQISYLNDEARPPFLLDDVSGVVFRKAGEVPTFVLRDALDFATYQCRGVPDTHLDRVEQKKF